MRRTSSDLLISRVPATNPRPAEPRTTQRRFFMSSRFTTNIGLALAGGFAIVASQVWSVPVFMWLMLGVGAAAIALSLTAALPSRGAAQRALDGITAALGAWTIVASL